MDNYRLKEIFDFETLEACPLCGNAVMLPDGRINWLEMNFWYVVCPGCGLKYMNPRPTKESYREFYKNLFWQQKIRNLGFKQEGQMWMGKKYKWDNEKKWEPTEGRANRIEKQREQRPKTIIPVIAENISLSENSKILEVGCGFGLTLAELARQYKCQIFALEPSNEAVKELKKIEGLNILGEYAEDLEKINNQLKFDAIIFSHSLENTTDPLRVIKMASSKLADRGIIYIQTPNLLTFDQMNPYHPFIFSRSSLALLAEKANLKFKPVSKLIERNFIAVFLK